MNVTSRASLWIAVPMLVCFQVAAAPPGEVTNLQWCAWPAKDCLTWTSVGNVQHRLYQGDRSTLPALLDGSADSCLFRIWNAASTSGPGQLTGVPSSGSLYWYLVVGKNCDGEGPSGNATAGPRTLDATGDCSPASCIDGVQDGAETNVDCGGGVCAGCATGSACCSAVDCAGLVCQAGTCSVPSCVDLVRNGTESDVDCGGGGCPRCADGMRCIVDGDCQSFVCSLGTCRAPTCSDAVKNATETDVDCGGGACPACALGRTCNVASDCQSGLCQAGVCAALGNGAICTGSSQCASGNCVDGVCCDTACGFLCQSCAMTPGSCTNIPAGQDPDNECPGSATCNGTGACNAPEGASCSIGSDCQNGNCVDAVCCNTACAGLCQACNVAGSVGTCANVPAGTDPANECAGAANCNGAGGCAAPNGTSCTFGGQCQSGNCVDNVCCNTTCAGLCQACNVAGFIGTCANVPAGTDPANECAGSANCNGAGGCAAANGTSCTFGGQCQSGNCVDAVCCNTTCAGQCQACNLAGSIGTCAFIPSGQDPAGECAGALVCDGSGGCF